MGNRMKECLSSSEPNYLYPFLMYREPGEDVSQVDIADEIKAIVDSGCGGFL